MSSPPSSSRGSSARKTPMSIKRSYSTRVQRRVRAGDVVMQGTLRHRAGDVNVSDAGRWSTRGRSRAALGLAVDGAPGRRPAAEAALEMGHARKPHLAQHVRGERGTLAAGTVHDDALYGIDLARVVVRRRVEPELEHATRHVGRAGNEAELAPLADVADVQDLDVTAGHLGFDLLDRQVLNPRLRFFDHLPDRLPRLPHMRSLSHESSHHWRDQATRWTPRSARCPGARARSGHRSRARVAGTSRRHRSGGYATRWARGRFRAAPSSSRGRRAG